MIAEAGCSMADHFFIVDFPQENLVMALAVLVQFQFSGHLVRQFAENADPFSLAENIGGNSRMQPRYILGTLHGERQSESFSQSFNAPFHGKEVFTVSEDAQPQMQPFLRQLLRLCRMINIAQFKDPAFRVPSLDVLNDDLQHARRQQGPHNAQFLCDRIHQADHLTFRSVGSNPQLVQIFIGIKRQGGDFTVSLGTHGPLDLVPAQLLRCLPAACDSSSRQESRSHMVISVLPDNFLSKVRFPDLNILPVPGSSYMQEIPVLFDFELEASQNPQDLLRRYLNAENGVDSADSRRKTLPFPRSAGTFVKSTGGYLAAFQLLDQV